MSNSIHAHDTQTQVACQTFGEVVGFTPCYDMLIQQFDLYSAAIYGMIERYSKMDHRQCEASIPTIARRLKLSRNTVLDRLKKLVEAGYLLRIERSGYAAIYQIPTMQNTIKNPPEKDFYPIPENPPPLQEMSTPPPRDGGVPLQEMEDIKTDIKDRLKTEKEDKVKIKQTNLPKQRAVGLFFSFSEDLQTAMIDEAKRQGARNPQAYVEAKLRNGWKPDKRVLLGPDHIEVRRSYLNWAG